MGSTDLRVVYQVQNETLRLLLDQQRTTKGRAYFPLNHHSKIRVH
jgi:hypothetical protein